MAGRIPQNFIDDLMNRIDVVEVIDARVPLKKAGREYKACCPFHAEKTPSFTVSSTKQFYHCFGCGAHGTAISFLMEFEHLSFPESIEELAHQAGLTVPRENNTQSSQATAVIQQKNDLYDLMSRAEGFYLQQLRQHKSAAIAVNYLKKRGLSGEIAAEYKIGYAPDGWDNLYRVLKTADYSDTQQIDSGMLIEKDNGKTYDRFRARIMFPIRDQRGRCIGFGGRALDDNNSGAKYLNSPETPLFHKGQELYGLYEVRQAVRQITQLLVVEGYMDVVSLAQFDIRYAVATLGTATTSEHLSKLFRLSELITFCFDGDRAGRDAAWRALENILPVMREGFECRFMFLAEGHDPDSEVREHGKQAFETQIQAAMPFSQYFFSHLSQSLDIESLDGRARLVQHAKPYIEKLPKGVYRQMMMSRLAEIAQIDIASLHSNIPIKPTNNEQIAPTRRTASAIKSVSIQNYLSPIRTLINLLLYKPKLALLANDTSQLTDLQLPGAGLLIDIIQLIQNKPDITTSAIIERYRDSQSSQHLQKLAAQSMLIEDQALDAEFNGALELLYTHIRNNRIEHLLQLSSQSSLNESEKNELKQLLERKK